MMFSFFLRYPGQAPEYSNGTQIGASAWVENPRVYFIPDGVPKPGKNVVAIRVLKTKPTGGFLAKPEELRVELGDKTSIPLAGEWKGQLSVDARPPHPLPIGYENWPVMPSVLYGPPHSGLGWPPQAVA
jgi:sialate O-acetylesterase